MRINDHSLYTNDSINRLCSLIDKNQLIEKKLSKLHFHLVLYTKKKYKQELNYIQINIFHNQLRVFKKINKNLSVLLII